jgi:hypothetical protein
LGRYERRPSESCEGIETSPLIASLFVAAPLDPNKGSGEKFIGQTSIPRRNAGMVLTAGANKTASRMF